MKSTLISFALLAAAASYALPADAQVSRKDYNSRVEASAQSDNDDDEGNTRSRKNYRRPDRPNTTTTTYRRSNNNTTSTTYGNSSEPRARGTTNTNRYRRTTSFNLGNISFRNWGNGRNARFQRNLEERAIYLYDWQVDLDRREAWLDGRRYREDPYALRDLLPNRRLSRGELNRWDNRLDRKEARLDERERRVRREERRWGARRGNRGSYGRTGGNGYCPPRRP